MAERKFNVDINLLTNQLINGVIHVSGSAPTIPAPKQGQIYYNSGDKTIYLYDGTNWKSLFTTKASETVLGLVELATLVQIALEQDEENGNPLVVKPSQLMHYYNMAITANVGGDLSGALPNPVVEQSSSTDGFLIKVSAGEVRLIPVDTSTLAVKNSGGSAYANLEALNVHVKGDLTVDGVVKQVATEEIQLEDSILVLNSNEAAAPTQDAGLEVERGTSTNVKLIWNETTDRWEINDGTNQFPISLKKVVTITGNGALTSFDVAHNLNTSDVLVQVFNSSNVQEECGIDTNYLNKIVVSFNTAPANGVTYKVVMNG